MLSLSHVPAACAAEPGSFLERFFAATGPMTAAERGAYLESPPDQAPDIEEAHQVRQGSWTAAVPPPHQKESSALTSLRVVLL